MTRGIAHVAVVVNGRTINVFSTHVDYYNSVVPHHANQPGEDVDLQLLGPAHRHGRLQHLAEHE